MTAQAITARMLADAKVKALTVCHDRHAAEMRGMCMTTPDAAVTPPPERPTGIRGMGRTGKGEPSIRAY